MIDLSGHVFDLGFDFTGFDTPTTWLVCFHSDARTPWVRLIPGRYKHVSAVGYCGLSRVWVGYDPAIGQTRLWVWRDGPMADRQMAEWMHSAAVVAMPAREVRGFRLRPGFWCVPAVAHLVGLRTGALRPDALLRDCLRNGGKLIADDPTDASTQDQSSP